MLLTIRQILSAITKWLFAATRGKTTYADWGICRGDKRDVSFAIAFGARIDLAVTSIFAIRERVKPAAECHKRGCLSEREVRKRRLCTVNWAMKERYAEGSVEDEPAGGARRRSDDPCKVGNILDITNLFPCFVCNPL